MGCLRRRAPMQQGAQGAGHLCRGVLKERGTPCAWKAGYPRGEAPREQGVREERHPDSTVPMKQGSWEPTQGVGCPKDEGGLWWWPQDLAAGCPESVARGEGARGAAGAAVLGEQAHEVGGGVGVQAQGRHRHVGGGVEPVLVVVVQPGERGVRRGGLRIHHLPCGDRHGCGTGLGARGGCARGGCA